LCLLAMLALGGGVAAHAEVTLGPLLTLNSRSANNQHPVVATSVDGKRTFAAWDGEVAGRRRIVVREAVEGIWLPELIVDNGPLGESTQPAIDVAPDGTPHLAWLSRENGRVVPRYATRIAGQWVQSDLGQSTSLLGNCDYVTIKVDDAGKPWLAWQVGQGSVYEIFCASLGADGTFEVENLTPGAHSHNLFPEIIFDPEPVIAWYTAREEQFFLVGERFDRETGRWGDFQLTNLDNLPAEPLPHLVSRTAGPLAALWYERAVGAAGEFSTSDRVLMAEQSAKSNGTGIVVDGRPDANNRLVAGAAAGDRVVAVWCSETADLQTRIILGHGKDASSFETVVAGEGGIPQSNNPKVTATDSTAAVVWESTAPAGGDGNIYYRSAALKP